MGAAISLTTWTTYTAGQEILCPAPSDRRDDDRASDRRRDPRFCNRVLGEVGSGLIVQVRVHPQGDGARPNPLTTTSDCKRCGRRIERQEDRAMVAA